MKLIVRMGVCWLAGFLLLPARGQAVVDWFQAAHSANHFTIPRYSEPDKQLYAVIGVEKAYTEYEKHGFFRIGALPVAVLDGVTYEVKDPALAAKNLSRLRTWLGGETGRHIELRAVKFTVSPTRRLESGRLLFLDNDRWELSGGVRLISGTNEIRAEAATLIVGGAKAGELVLQTTPPTTNIFLFSRVSPIPDPVAVNTAIK